MDCAKVIITDLAHVHAPIDGMPVAVFWDVENIRIVEPHVEQFVKTVRNNLNNFQEKMFVAPASLRFWNRYNNCMKKLNEQNVSTLSIPSGKNEADEKIMQEMEKFRNEYGRKSCMILITGDTDFHDEIKKCKNDGYENIVLIYDDRQNVSTKIQNMVNDVHPLTIPLKSILPKKHCLRKRKSEEVICIKSKVTRLSSVQKTFMSNSQPGVCCNQEKICKPVSYNDRVRMEKIFQSSQDRSSAAF